VIIDQVGAGPILDVQDGGVSKVVVDAQGNVGIGTATPTQTLHVNGDIQSPALVGQVAYFAMSAAPTGWLKCNGATISRTTYAALFAAIGTTFGVGNGTTTFNVPDLRGEFVRGWDDSRGIDSARTFASAQSDDFKSHTHDIEGRIQNYAGGGGTQYHLRNQNDPGTLTNVVVSNAAQSRGGSETRPRNIALLACIKY